jgi:hypothetical protein
VTEVWRAQRRALDNPSIILIFLTGVDAGPGCANIIYFSSILFFHTERRKSKEEEREV